MILARNETDILFMFKAVSIYERLWNVLSTVIITGIFKMTAMVQSTKINYSKHFRQGAQ